MRRAESRYAIAKAMGVPTSSLYYRKKLPEKDRELKIRIEEALRYHPAYGHRRLAIHLGANKKRVLRVMKLFLIKPYRRRGRKFGKHDAISVGGYPNLVKGVLPSHESHIWAADFTYLPLKKRFVYLSTVMDVFTREIVGWTMMANRGAALVLQAFFNAIQGHGRPQIFHSDNGREYGAKVVVRALANVGVAISRTAPASPWENGYQESFFSQFKIDLGDPERFSSLGELVYAVATTVWEYNHTRIHLALKMPPKQFALSYGNLTENSSKERGA
ncbi:MAG TPA: IS3 family transposase [Candidatus Tyrphobacter sp.]|nr:IS3 family transposase [Candidatus Tyrphobacter sp.]